MSEIWKLILCQAEYTVQVIKHMLLGLAEGPGLRICRSGLIVHLSR